MKDSKSKKKYSKDVKKKALRLKELLPGIDMSLLLSFVENAPEDLDLVELMENFKH